jgi:hypothetical protein
MVIGSRWFAQPNVQPKLRGCVIAIAALPIMNVNAALVVGAKLNAVKGKS